MATQRHEMEAWLGDDHGLTDAQVDELIAQSDAIGERYLDPDDADSREAALTVAYRLMVEDPETVVAGLRRDLMAARDAEASATAALRQAAHAIVDISRGARGITSQLGFAAAAGVDRQAVREWLGLSRHRPKPR